MPEVRIGTSGWSYEHWKDNFYPKGLKSRDWLKFYGDVFSTVEINNTFYHMPSESAVQNWHSQVPHEFLFSIKASNYITHIKRLQSCEESVQFLYKRLEGLKSKLGPILFQLPPSFRANLERFNDFIKCLDKKHRHVFEFRHESWYIPEIYDLMSKHKIALCITDLNGTLSPEEITTDFTYIRLHGPHTAYQGFYTPSQLRTWKKKIEAWSSHLSVYCYFDNDEKGFAIQDAKKLQKLLV